jgi:site-specific DNA recombinase
MEAQEARIRAFVASQGAELGTVHRDAGITGTSTDNRPGLAAALDEACAQKAALVVYSLARLARDTRSCLDISLRLERAGADLISLTEQLNTSTAAGKMVFRMLAVMAEHESDQIQERTRNSLRHLRSLNRRVSGKIPFGHDLGANGVLIPNAAEQAAIASMRRWRTEGASWSAIASKLTVAGTASKYGKMWRGDAVRQMVERAERDERERQQQRATG